MDFFSAQEAAQRRTGRLIALFTLAVLGTVLACVLAALLIHWWSIGGGREQRRFYHDYRAIEPAFWSAKVALLTGLGTLSLIGGACLAKWSQLREGGAAIARMMGGTALSPLTQDPAEKRLINIVEEMAIASGTAVPRVFVMNDEPGINAFAAGLDSTDAVIAVTRGTLDTLNRDELQGVIAHEFSHILHGDMRMNVRLTSLLFGILVLGLFGQGMLNTFGRFRTDGKRNGAVGVIVLGGLALFVIGYIGYFFGRLIQAAVSRQREYLADASAVQFTRNPQGIAGALKKIAASGRGTTLLSDSAGQFGHFFFADGLTSNLAGLLDTHPDLEERIRAIEPTWNGEIEPQVLRDLETRQNARQAGIPPIITSPPLPPIIQVLPQAAKTVVQSAGLLSRLHFERANQLVAQLPESLRAAAADASQVGDLFLALLNQENRQTNHHTLAREIRGLDRESRLALVQLGVQGLRGMRPEELDQLLETAREIILSDGGVTPFEFCMVALVRRTAQQLRSPGHGADFYSFQAVAAEIRLVLSSIAWSGSDHPNDALHAMSVAATQLPLLEGKLSLLPEEECRMNELLEAYEKLARASLAIKQRTLAAAAHLIGADGKLTPEEIEMIRALSACLDCPIPLGGSQ